MKQEINSRCNNIMRMLAFLGMIILVSCTKDQKEPDPESRCYSEDYPPRNSEKVTIDQGLWGDVWFWKGDFMPVGFGTICQVKRTIYIYELTHISEVVRTEPYTSFYSRISTLLVTTVESDSTGFFQIKLDPGSYSIFVKEDNSYYSNLFDGNGAIFPVIIQSGKVTEIRFDITYNATF